MNYLKKASSKLSKTLKSIPKPSLPILNILSSNKNQTTTMKLLSSLAKSRKQILSSTKMSEIAKNSYETQQFEEIVNFLLHKVSEFTFDYEKAFETRNCLIVLGYLLKNGASGFIDQLKENKHIFENYKQLHYNYQLADTSKSHTKIVQIVQQVKERANYILNLVQDPKQMQQEKRLVMLVKQKIMEKLEPNTSFKHSNNTQHIEIKGDQGKKLEKISDFIENYVYHYWNKLDQKLQKITDKLIMKIDDYLVGEIPESFEIDQAQQMEEKVVTEPSFGQYIAAESKKFYNQRTNTHQQSLI